MKQTEIVDRHEDLFTWLDNIVSGHEDVSEELILTLITPLLNLACVVAYNTPIIEELSIAPRGEKALEKLYGLLDEIHKPEAEVESVGG
jgi:hypothetical protein